MPIKKNNEWYNYQCCQAKKLYKTAKRKDSSNKDEGNLANLRAMGNAYKSIIRAAKRQHRQKIAGQIIHNRSNNPKQFWSYINGKKSKPDVPVSLDSLMKHFF